VVTNSKLSLKEIADTDYATHVIVAATANAVAVALFTPSLAIIFMAELTTNTIYSF
jgi:hypothetical protein